MKGHTSVLAEYLSKLSFDTLPEKVIKKAKYLLLDYIGYTISSYKEDAAEIIVSVISKIGGKPESTVLGYGVKTSCLLAAFANGAMAHMTELDDTHTPTMSHPGDTVISAALALGEREGISGKELLTAIVAGYEAALRIGEAVMPTHYWRGFHPSGTINTFGAAAAAGRVLNLTPSQMASALGLAGLQASGYFYFVDEGIRMPKDFNVGRAALSGVLAALLAREGFQGGTTVLESEHGFCRLFADPFSINIGRITENLGKQFKILEVSHKPYSACRHMHAAIDALLHIIKEHKISPGEVEEVVASIFSTGARFVDDPEPWRPERGPYGPRFSTQFNLAIALVEREEGIRRLFDREYAKAKLNDPYVRELMKKIKVVPDPELDKEFPRMWSTIVEVKTKRGVYSHRVDYPKGEPRNPMNYEELLTKFRILTSKILRKDIIEEIINTINNLEKVGDVKELTDLLIKGRIE
jgi:2-methylcitrate dehydratase PrpD